MHESLIHALSASSRRQVIYKTCLHICLLIRYIDSIQLNPMFKKRLNIICLGNSVKFDENEISLKISLKFSLKFMSYFTCVQSSGNITDYFRRMITGVLITRDQNGHVTCEMISKHVIVRNQLTFLYIFRWRMTVQFQLLRLFRPPILTSMGTVRFRISSLLISSGRPFS